MKKLIMTAALAVLAASIGACHSARPTTSTSPAANSNMTGAPDATAAVRFYLKAVEQQDLQAMGAVWGGPEGPARDLLLQNELYQREIILVCTLKHDRYDIVGDAPNANGGRLIVVNMFTGKDSHSRTFDVVEGPQGRWYVRSVDLKTLAGCGRS